MQAAANYIAGEWLGSSQAAEDINPSNTADVVGLFAPGMGVGTVRKIAANAVMAGAQPSAMPVIMAMMECVLDPSIGLRTWAMSTGPQAPIVLVSGDIADEIGMNRGMCALGPGSISQVNVAIGRTLRLVMMNVGLSYPGISDMDTIGTPMKFSACVAENEERTPWESWRVQQGFAPEESTVSNSMRSPGAILSFGGLALFQPK